MSRKYKYVIKSDEELTLEKVREFIDVHLREKIELKKKMEIYKGEHDILKKAHKEKFKPDNRLVVNFAKYIVDTLNGYFLGIPLKTVHDKDEIAKEIERIEKYNDQDDNNSELSKMCSIYGRAYELLYIDENAQVCITYVSPEDAFLITDNSIRERAVAGVRYYEDDIDKNIHGSYSTADKIYYFEEIDGKLMLVDEQEHYFKDVPLIEYVENAEKQGAFDNVQTLIDAYDKAISEKANDVDYYADAYLLILGSLLDEETIAQLRDNRIINMEAPDIGNFKIEFLEKPSSDATQENLINRLEKLIFQISMVANINDENFGNATGISLKYKLQSMSNLTATKERKFTSGMNKRWKLISNLPNTRMTMEDWLGINYQYTRNLPSNILEETEVAQNVSGITSQETQLKVLSIVDDVKAEIEKKEREEQNKINKLIEPVVLEQGEEGEEVNAND